METTTGQTRRVQNLLLDIRDSRGAPPRLRPLPARAIRAFKPRFDQPSLRPADPSSNHHAPPLRPVRSSTPPTSSFVVPVDTRRVKLTSSSSHAIRAGSVPAPSPRTRSPPGDIPPPPPPPPRARRDPWPRDPGPRHPRASSACRRRRPGTEAPSPCSSPWTRRLRRRGRVPRRAG